MHSKNIISIKILSIAFFCCLPFLLLANTEEEKVAQAYYTWCQDLGSAHGKPEKIVALYAQDAILLPTLSADILDNSKQELFDYFKNLTSKKDFACHTEQLTTKLYGDVAINYGLYNFSFTAKKKKIVLPARFNFVYQKQAGKWLIINHHSSQLPK